MNGRKSLPPRTAMLLAFAGMSIVNYAFGLVMGWLLVPGDFGLLAFVQTLLTIGGILLNSGFTWSLAARLVHAAPAERNALVRGAGAGNLLLALALAAILLLLYALGPFRAGLESWTVALLVAGTLPALAVLTIARATVQGHEHFGMLAVLLAGEVGVKAAAGIALVRLGYGPEGAIAGFLVGSVVAALIGVGYLVLKLGFRPWGRLRRPELGEAGAMGAALLGMALLLHLDVMGLKLLAGDRAAVGHYQAGIVLANMPYYLLTALIPVLFTQLARERELRRTGPGVAEVLRFALTVLFPLEAALALFPGWFLGLLFPEAYGGGVETLRILAIANAAVILVAILATAFQATGRAASVGRTLLAITAAEAVALRLVVPVQGSRGAALVFLAAALVAAVALAAEYRMRLGEGLPVAARRWLAKYGLAGGLGLAAVLLVHALKGSDLAALVAAGAVYAPLVLGLRLISPAGLLGARRSDRATDDAAGRPGGLRVMEEQA